jgi:hypothetical protein
MINSATQNRSVPHAKHVIYLHSVAESAHNLRHNLGKLNEEKSPFCQLINLIVRRKCQFYHLIQNLHWSFDSVKEK